MNGCSDNRRAGMTWELTWELTWGRPSIDRASRIVLRVEELQERRESAAICVTPADARRSPAPPRFFAHFLACGGLQIRAMKADGQAEPEN